MQIKSLNQRDDAKKDAGSATVELSGLELIALSNILCKVTKEAECRSEILLGMAKAVYTANSIVQHGSLDRIDLQKLEELQCT